MSWYVLRAIFFIATAGVATVLFSNVVMQPEASMRLEPTTGVVALDETFVVEVVVDASVPVNAFKGLLTFDPSLLSIERIDYNTSIADLWAELPWYSNGAGTLNFVGGTTRPGGFTGTDKLITVTFKARSSGEANLQFTEVRIMHHNGLGTDAKIVAPIDSLFTVETVTPEQVTILEQPTTIESIKVVSSPVDTDLNHDGKYSLADQSIFMVHLTTQNLRSDFNNNGRVGIDDLSILLDTPH